MSARLLHRWLVFAAVVMVTASLSGCNNMFRRMTIRSEPAGALVIVDGEEVGYTPWSGDFIYYGAREITLVKDGYETLTVLQEVPAPWYQQQPVEFFSDNFLPVKVTNRHEFVYCLQPQDTVPRTEQLLDRANQLRSESQIGP